MSHSVLILIATVSTVLGCGPGGLLSADTQWDVTLSPIAPPVQFVYTPMSLPSFQSPRTAGEAIRNIESFTRDIITSQMRQYIPETLFIPASMVSNMLTDFNVKVSPTYVPLQCTNFVAGYYFGLASTVAPPADTTRNGDWCIYNNEWVITSYCKNVTATTPNCPTSQVSLPLDYQRITFVVTPGTGLLSYQPRRFWNDFMERVVAALKTSSYSSAFQDVGFTIAKSA